MSNRSAGPWQEGADEFHSQVYRRFKNIEVRARYKAQAILEEELKAWDLGQLKR